MRITALGLLVKWLPDYLELVFAAPCWLIGIPMIFILFLFQHGLMGIQNLKQSVRLLWSKLGRKIREDDDHSSHQKEKKK